MEIKIWDKHNKQWLEPMSLTYGRNNTIVEVKACIVGGSPLKDGWYNIGEADLNKIEILRSTGLKVTNGVLFEGDTFKYKKHLGYLLESFTSTVIWYKEHACFGYIENGLVVPFSKHDELQTDFLNHCKITGSAIK